MKKLLLVLMSFLLFTACEKDDKGYYLSPNYCTATINGNEYINRESYAIIPMWGNFPSAELYADDFYVNHGMWRDNLNIAVISCSHSEKTTDISATGTIRFGNHNQKGCQHENNRCFEADITLHVKGDAPISFNGHIYTYL